MFFGGWQPLLRVVVISTCAYVGLIIILRVSGKRTLSKFNAFDFIVTIALGSTLATAILSKDTALAQSLAALSMLALLQFIVTFASTRSRRVARLVAAEPRLLLFRGQFLDDAMRTERMTRDEVIAAVREQNIASLEEVEAVVLETAGTVSVIRKSNRSDQATGTLKDVWGVQDALRGHGDAGSGSGSGSGSAES